MLFDNCCFRIDLRTSCIIIAILEIIVWISITALNIVWLYNVPCWWVYTAGLSIHIVGHGFLLFGAMKKNRIATLAHLIIEIFAMGLFMTSIIWLFVVVSISDWSLFSVPIVDIIAVVMLVNTLLCINFWLCAFAFLKSLENGSNTQENEMKTLKSEIDYC